MKSIPQLVEGERAIAKLTPELVKEAEELEVVADEIKRLVDKATKMQNSINARSVLFWEKVEGLTEITETANSRGFIMHLRTDNNNIVVIEKKPEQINPLDALNNLKRLMGLQ